MSEPSSIIEVYQLHVWLCEISPLIWRRLLVRSDSTIADLHRTLQIAMGWDDAHLHRFRIRGKDYGISRMGGIGFRDDPCQVHLADFHFRPNERFLYEYDFGDLWQHVVRVERRLPWDRKRIYPVCIDGKRTAPPEDCGGPWAFMALQDEYSPGYFLDRYADLLESVRAGDLDEARDQLAEAKALLQGVQRTMVAEQPTAYLDAQYPCPACGTLRRCKGHHQLVYRTVFGKLTLSSPRWYACRCQTTERRSSSPLADLLPERTAPELLYLEAKFAALMSYGVTVDVLGEIVPIGAQLNATTVQRHLLRVAERVEQELGEEQAMFVEGCPAEWEDLPAPDAPLTVGLDGGYVHARDERSRKAGWFEVIVGKSVPDEGASKCFGFVHTYDTRPKRRLFEVLKSQGMQANQQVTFLSDGGETVRELPMYFHLEAEHLLDWFHISMRVTVMGQMAKGLTARESTDASGDIEKQLERAKWYLWHGNVFRALQGLEELAMDLDDIKPVTEGLKKLRKAVHEFQGYIAVNKPFIPNYGDRYRHGETISTAFVESTVNQVVSRRMVKQQQMRWTQRGAHLLLQVRTQTLNDDLRATFGRWYPGMQTDLHQDQEAA